MTASVVGSFVVAVIALAIAIAALDEAKGNNTSSTTSSEVFGTVIPQTNEIVHEVAAGQNEIVDKVDADRPLPGSKDYDGYHPTSPVNRFTLYLDVVVHGHVARQFSARLQKGIDDAARLFKCLRRQRVTVSDVLLQCGRLIL